MKKKNKILIIVVIMLVILFVPIPSGTYKDGGTRAYTALTYKLVVWNRLVSYYNTYENNSMYFFPNNFKSIDALWEYEVSNARYPFYALVLEIDESYVLVEPLSDKGEKVNNEPVYFEISSLPKMDVEVGDYIKAVHTGSAATTNPAYIDVVHWEIATELQGVKDEK